MSIALVAAVAENRVIGRDNSLPWRLPGDLPHFRRLSMGKTVVMGRRTFESIGHPLEGRCNIVLSRARNFSPAGVQVVRSVDEALAVGRRRQRAEELLVIGGAAVYEAFLPVAQKLYLSLVHASPRGDCHFPQIPAGASAADAWRLLSCCRIVHEAPTPAVSYMVLGKGASCGACLCPVESARFRGSLLYL